LVLGQLASLFWAISTTQKFGHCYRLLRNSCTYVLWTKRQYFGHLCVNIYKIHIGAWSWKFHTRVYVRRMDSRFSHMPEIMHALKGNRKRGCVLL
jgi:hypothetical protein